MGTIAAHFACRAALSISVATGPGDTQFTRMPCAATSRDRPMHRLLSPPFDAAYQTYSPEEPRSAAREEMKVIEPPDPAILRTASRAESMAPVRLTSTTSRSVSVVASARVEAAPVIPLE